jgi:hypothetical protein
VCWTEWFLSTSRVHGQHPFGEGGIGDFAARPWLCAVLCETTKQVVNLSAHQDGRRPSTGIPEILETKASIAET